MSEKDVKRGSGVNDRPIETEDADRFGIKKYVESLSEFILECQTPMTIAIQGDWGTGKTSMMKMVGQQLKEKAVTIEFNTWQYSQFNLGDQLSILLMNKLIGELGKDNEKSSVKNAREVLVKISKGVANAALGHVSNGTASVDQFIIELDFVDQLVSLRNSFQQLINDKIEASQNANGRVVIFIDDLDRLQPQKAVELLEVMKVFLDCENCVFVLAIDYSVVSQGIKAKFGDSVSDEKGRSFFDKIIQLPFKMPVSQYSIDEYLKNLMSDIWGEVTEDENEDIDSYINIIDNSIGRNPRSIKRAVNSFNIITRVARKQNAISSEAEMQKHQFKVLFAALCMQLASEPLYQYILENSDDFLRKGDSFINQLRDDEKFVQVLGSVYHLQALPAYTDEIFVRNNALIEKFCDWCENLAKASNDTQGTKYREVVNILSFSSITANDTGVVRTRNQPIRVSIDQLFTSQQTDDCVNACYYAFENNVAKVFSREQYITEGFAGQSSIVFKYIDARGKKRNFAEFRVQKKSATMWLYHLPKEEDQTDSLFEACIVRAAGGKLAGNNRDGDYRFTGVITVEQIEAISSLIPRCKEYVETKYGKY